ncbi:DUF6656 family protein [Mycoplana ramosa]|uniref:DUF6656 family protein n=1 Tax=Mycoplana ramosa TaxID=40837 RepID=A0ABW3YU42_MYCRA
MQPTPTLKYYDAAAYKRAQGTRSLAHTEFLRTGKLDKLGDGKRTGKRYMSYPEVAEQTGRKLEKAGTLTHARINGFHRAIRFPKLIFHRTLASMPHLGYCHVTLSKTRLARQEDVQWSFYMANFYAEIGDGERFFEAISPKFSRMYFAVATCPSQSGERLEINRAVGEDGVLFHTHDPKLAMKNVLLLGARSDELRKIIRAI